MPDSNAVHDSGADDIRWQDYEELVKDIYEVLGRANGVTIECWGSSCRVEGPPGVFHQIDVLTVHSDGLHHYRTAISCKNWNNKVGIPIVREFSQIIDDARLSKGVIVSKMGFTKPAMAYAEAKNIGLVELRKPLDKLGFTQFKRRKRGNPQAGGIEWWGVPACRGQRPTVRNPLTPATDGVAPGRWRPRRWATVCHTRRPCAG